MNADPYEEMSIEQLKQLLNKNAITFDDKKEDRDYFIELLESNNITPDTKMQLKEKNIDQYFQTISKKLEIEEKDMMKEEKKDEIDNKMKIIDTMYQMPDALSLQNFLIEQKMLPDSRTGNKMVKEACQELKNNLDAKRAQAEYIKQLANDEQAFIDGVANNRIKLEQKSNRTEEENIALQGLVVLEANPNGMRLAFEEAKERITDADLYIGIGTMVKSSLVKPFVEL
jgi:hypothetical protein